MLAGEVETAAALTTALRDVVVRERAEDCREWDIALFGDDDEGEEVEEDDSGMEDEPELIEDHVEGEKAELDEAQKRLVLQVHMNAGHPEKNRFLRMLKVAGASRATLQFTQQEFICDQCHSSPRPRPSRKVAFARTFQLNAIIGVELFYLTYQGQAVIMLNIIDHGTNYQSAARCRSKDARDISRQIAKVLIQVFGAPQVLLSDGGPDFRRET